MSNQWGAPQVASIIDPDPSHDYPGNFDDIARGTKVLFSGLDNVKKFTLNTLKFDYVLNTLASKSKALIDLTHDEIVNLAKSNLRFEYFKKLALNTEAKVAEFINNAWETGIYKESSSIYGLNITKQVIRDVDGVPTTFNVNFIIRNGEQLPDFTGISVPAANKGLQKEIDRLKSLRDNGGN